MERLHAALRDVANNEGLNAKLAEYALFPLTIIYNEMNRMSARCGELALRCLQILIEDGWRDSLSGDLAKHLIIWSTMMAGGVPGQVSSQHPKSEELTVAAFDVMASVCRVVSGKHAVIFNQVENSTLIDQTVYVLLEAIVEGSSGEVQLSAASCLAVLDRRITDRVVLASLLPRTASSLTKVLRPTTETRRSPRVLCACLGALKDILQTVLNDSACETDSARSTGTSIKSKPEPPSATVDTSSTHPKGLVLDDSWLKATASKVKLVLANVIPLRTHDRFDVREHLLDLCVMIMENCPKSLADSTSMIVETLIVLSGQDDDDDSSKSYSALTRLTLSSDVVRDLVKSHLHSWAMSLPRVMQSNDDTAKKRAIRRMSTAFRVTAQAQSTSEILRSTLVSSICDSVSVAAKDSPHKPQPIDSRELDIGKFDDLDYPLTFPPVLMESQSQRDTLAELNTLIAHLSNTDTSLSVIRSTLDSLHGAVGEATIAPFWLTLSFLRTSSPETSVFHEFLNIDSQITPSRASLIEELYSFALPYLTEYTATTNTDWRISAMSLEAVTLQAQQLGESFRPELIDTLYPVLQMMGSSDYNLRRHAMTALNILTSSCRYQDARTMLIENVDYLVNSVALKLNSFDVSPQAPRVLLMIVQLCGAGLIPYLDDIIDSLFAILDAFHGHPKLVELIFEVLAAVVSSGSREPGLLAIKSSEGETEEKHLRKPYPLPSVSDVAKQIRNRREKQERFAHLEKMFDGGGSDEEDNRPPLGPLSSEMFKPNVTDEEDEELPEEGEGGTDTLPPPKEDENGAAPSKAHNLLLNIIKSIPAHLSSPSPLLRRSLLGILQTALPVLAKDENSFLPVINDLWPSVSVRVTVPSTASAPLKSTSIIGDELMASQSPRPIDEHGIQEETYVTVAACQVIATMCRTAGSFMRSRLEAEFPRWKSLYSQVWLRVKIDLEKSSERQRLMERKNVSSSSNNSNNGSIYENEIIRQHKTASGGRRPTPLFGKKSFTSHGSILVALIDLFTAMLEYVRLPQDIGVTIANMMVDCLSFRLPGYFFTYEWRSDGGSGGNDNGPYDDEEGEMGGVNRAMRAMYVFNSDLTWYLFEMKRKGSKDQKKAWGCPVGSGIEDSTSSRWKFASFDL